MSYSFSLNQKELHNEIIHRLMAVGLKPIRACFYHPRPGLIRLDLVRGYAPAMDRVHVKYSPSDAERVRAALGELLPQVVMS